MNGLKLKDCDIMKLILSDTYHGFPSYLLDENDVRILNEGYNDAKAYLADPSIKDQLYQKYDKLPKAHWKIWTTIDEISQNDYLYNDIRQSEEAIKAIEQFKDPTIQKAFKDATDGLQFGKGAYSISIPREWEEPW